MANSKTTICNMALGRIGNLGNMTDVDADNSDEANACKLFYDQTRDAALRLHEWAFAKARVSLSQSTTDPAFEYDNQFQLPSDFVRIRTSYDDTVESNINNYTYEIEGDLLLTNESSVDLKYIKRVTDEAKFDHLFVEVLVLMLALKLSTKFRNEDTLHARLQKEFAELILPLARIVNRTETNTKGKSEKKSWNTARLR